MNNCLFCEIDIAFTDSVEKNEFRHDLRQTYLQIVQKVEPFLIGNGCDGIVWVKIFWHLKNQLCQKVSCPQSVDLNGKSPRGSRDMASFWNNLIIKCERS